MKDHTDISADDKIDMLFNLISSTCPHNSGIKAMVMNSGKSVYVCFHKKHKAKGCLLNVCPIARNL